jgi:hypothetical protein
MRLAMIALVALATIVTGSMAVSMTAPADAQDQTDDRLTALETTVAEQGEDISSLRNRVRALEDAASTTGNTSDDGDGDGGGVPAGGVTVSGTGSFVSDTFQLAAGRYKVSATVEVTDFDGFSVTVYAPDGDRDLLFNEIIDEGGTWTGSAVYDAPATGEYFVEVSNTTSSWSLVFEPI